MNPRAAFDSDALDRLRSSLEPVDASRVKRIGVVTYFGVYALIAIGGWRALVGFTQVFPELLRPPALPPLHVLLGLPRSVAWGLVSLSIALSAVGIVTAAQVARAHDDTPHSLDDLGSDWTFDTSRFDTSKVETALAEASQAARERYDSVTSALHDGRGSPDAERSAGPDLAVVDGSLDQPADPLSLSPPAEPNRSSVGLVGPEPVPDASVLTIDSAVQTTDAEILDTEGTEIGTRSDGGDDAATSGPDPHAPWPEDVDPADAEEYDEDAPWPDDWIPGDEL